MTVAGALLAVLLAGTAPVTDVRAPGSALAEPGDRSPTTNYRTPTTDDRSPTTEGRQPSADEPPPSAYDKAREHDGQAPETQSLVGQFIKTLVALAMVIAIIWVIFRFGAARLLPGLFATTAGSGGRILRVVERVALDQRSSLVIVDAGNERLLLGVAPSQVTFIAHLDKAATAEPTQPRGSPVGFRSVLEGLSPKKPADSKTPSEDDDAPK